MSQLNTEIQRPNKIKSEWLEIRSGCGFLIYSAREGLTRPAEPGAAFANSVDPDQLASVLFAIKYVNI